MIQDLIQPFQIEPHALRGRLVRLGPALDTIIQQHAYPEPVARLLAEALTLAVLLAGALKYDGVFTLQTKGDGAISLMVADVTTDGAVRGYAQFDEERLVGAMAGGANASLPRLLGAGYLAFTVDQGEFTERYQGIVELTGSTLAECVHHYFQQSEQIQAAIKVAAAPLPADPVSGEPTRWRAGGIMIQRLPPVAGMGVSGIDEIESRLSLGGELAREAQDEAWRGALALMASSTSAELLDPALNPDRLLYRLFHEQGVRVYDQQPLLAKCRCSRDRIERVLRSLPQEEVATMKIDDLVAVTCEFCGCSYSFDDAELAEVYAS